MREQTKEKIRSLLSGFRADPSPTCEECQSFYDVVAAIEADEQAERNMPQGDLETIRRLEGQ